MECQISPPHSKILRNPLRVAQLDSGMLDDELKRSVKELIVNKVGRLRLKDSQLELLSFAVSQSPILVNGYSYGCKLQNLIPADESLNKSTRKRIQYFLLMLLYKHPQEVSNLFLRLQGQQELVKRIAKYLWRHWEDLSNLTTLANFLAFLYQGQFRTCVERVLSIKLAYASRESVKNLNFEYMNHQLIWRSFTEFLLFILPQVKLARWKNFVAYWWRNATFAGRNRIKLSGKDTCYICDETSESSPPILPHKVVPCGHVFCYYCVKSQMAQSEVYYCPVCQEKAASLTPVYAD